ncbi:MAG: 50S ribosomal protein L30 [candidate division KSB1 bacterium]|nr:50S ribosomal protein L30 [candidate division KSB1 bacterium]
MAKKKQIKITLTKSPIGYNQKQRSTVDALGIRKMHQSVVHNDTPQIRGMIEKISHLVTIEEVS